MKERKFISLLIATATLCVIFSCVDVAWRWDTVFDATTGREFTSHSVGVMHGAFAASTKTGEAPNPTGLFLKMHWPEFRPVYFADGKRDSMDAGVSVLAAIPMLIATMLVVWRYLRFVLVWCTVVWVLGVLFVLVFWPDFFVGLWMLAILASHFTTDLRFFIQALMVLSVVLLLALAAICWRRGPKTSAVCAAIAVLTTVFTFTIGVHAGKLARFALFRGGYESQLATIVREHAAGRPIDEKSLPDLAHIDEGPPLRVAFYWQRGITDNWIGVVYDPTGEVMKANEFKPDWSNWEEPKLRSVKMLFGGDMHQAEHLAGPWYLCWFT